MAVAYVRRRGRRALALVASEKVRGRSVQHGLAALPADGTITGPVRTEAARKARNLGLALTFDWPKLEARAREMAAASPPPRARKREVIEAEVAVRVTEETARRIGPRVLELAGQPFMVLVGQDASGRAWAAGLGPLLERDDMATRGAVGRVLVAAGENDAEAVENLGWVARAHRQR